MLSCPFARRRTLNQAANCQLRHDVQLARALGLWDGDRSAREAVGEAFTLDELHDERRVLPDSSTP
ncbi:MAG: hypothetical protein ACRD1H_20410 [Vicinamibacterales bacterium]